MGKKALRRALGNGLLRWVRLFQQASSISRGAAIRSRSAISGRCRLPRTIKPVSPAARYSKQRQKRPITC